MAGLFERHNRSINDAMNELDKDAPGARTREAAAKTAGEPLSKPKITPGPDPTYDATRKKR